MRLVGGKQEVVRGRNSSDEVLERQGFGFLTSEPVRVVFQPKEGEEDLDKELVDVPKDGKTVGEIVMRGNISLKEVSLEAHIDGCELKVS